MTDDQIHKGTKGKRRLCAWHYHAVELRYVGKTYEEIAETLTGKYTSGIRGKFTAAGVRGWLARGGVCSDLYDEYARQENEHRRRIVLEELKKLAGQIPLVLQEILDRRIIKVDKKTGEIVETDKKVRDKTSLAAIQTLARLLGFQVNAGEGGDDPADRFFDQLDREYDERNPAEPEQGQSGT